MVSQLTCVEKALHVLMCVVISENYTVTDTGRNKKRDLLSLFWMFGFLYVTVRVQNISLVTVSLFVSGEDEKCHWNSINRHYLLHMLITKTGIACRIILKSNYLNTCFKSISKHSSWAYWCILVIVFYLHNRPANRRFTHNTRVLI